METYFYLAARHNLTEESLFRTGPLAPGLRESVATMVGIATAELRTARECFDNTEDGVPEAFRGVFLNAVSIFPSSLQLSALD